MVVRNSDAPLDDTGFATLMAAFEPFEPSPGLAVAVSGGGDSMALLRLAAVWAAARRGGVLALTVDHGLRPESAGEARRIAERCRILGIAHEVLSWSGPTPTGSLQAAAREARYRLLDSACRRHGLLHLLVAHHSDDQVETMLLRLARGSGLRGLAAMSPVRHLDSARLIRPLLAVSRQRLRATLHRLGEDWIEDPSNDDAVFDRVAVRRALTGIVGASRLQRRLAETSVRLAADRAVVDEALVALLAAAVTVSPHGYAEIDRHRLAAGRPALVLAILARTILVVGAGDYPPRAAALARLAALVTARDAMPPRTLGGCRILATGSRLVVCREPSAAGPAVLLESSGAVLWDRRFRIAVARPPAVSLDRPLLTAGPLGPSGWRPLASTAAAAAIERAVATVPPAARTTLPAVRDEEGLLGVPSLDLWHERAQDVRNRISVRFVPPHALGPPVAGIAPDRGDGSSNLRL